MRENITLQNAQKLQEVADLAINLIENKVIK